MGRGGDTTHTLLMKGIIGVGTPHDIEKKSKPLNGTGWSGQLRSLCVGQVGCAAYVLVRLVAQPMHWSVLAENNTTSWLHLASWNLQDSQLS